MGLAELKDAHFDVIVCGAGLAGLCLARQLRLELPELSVALIDPHLPPLPEAGWKVGESTVEFGAHYLAEYLQLREYLERAHLIKLGLRFFFPSKGPMSQRPEVGLSDFASVLAYQIDRGILENDLREMAREDGTVFLEGCQVRAIHIAEAGGPHAVRVTDLPSGTDGELRCRWIADASGRRQLIQRKLNLRRPSRGYPCSAAWFRLTGRRDVDHLVPEGDTEWHGRVRKGIRYFSTNHLCGRGYWVWLIPLSSNTTSIGIVARGDIHPFETFNTYERALAWLKQHEPELARYLGEEQPIDFRAMKEYSYTSERAFSPQRWVCVGEAAVFSDPFYSPGTDLIAIGNTMTCDLIRRDYAGNHNAGRIDRYSGELIALNDRLTEAIQNGYGYLGDETVALARGIWAQATLWGHLCPQVFNRTFVDDEKLAALRPVGVLPLFALADAARRLFDEWLALRSRLGGNLSFDFFDYLNLPWIAEFRLKNLRQIDSVEELKAQYRSNIEMMEGLLQALFLLAVEDLRPEEMARLSRVKWLNVQKLSLDPDQWDTSGLFQPQTRPREFLQLYDQIRAQLWQKAPRPISEARVDHMAVESPMS
jgi:flavin-dependent dehydrogenase